MTIDLDRKHPSYVEHVELVKKVHDTMRDDLIKKNKKKYLPMPSAVYARSLVPETAIQAEKSYQNLGEIGHLPSTTSETLNQALGVFFSQSPTIPEDYEDEIVTDTGLTPVELLRNIAKAVFVGGRKVLVVDSSLDGAQKYITEYDSAALDDWKTDKSGNLIYCKLLEGLTKDKRKAKICRVYQMIDGVVTVTVYHNKDVFQEPRIINLAEIPVIPIGSIDCTPSWDEIPLLKVAEMMIQYYRLSCYYYRAMCQVNDFTPYASGLKSEEPQAFASQGFGNGAFWASTGDGAGFGVLELSGNGLSKTGEELEKIKAQAVEYGVNFIAGANDAAETVRLRKEAKLMSFQSVADSCGQGLSKALYLLDELAGTKKAGLVSVNLPDTSPAFTLDGVNASKVWLDTGVLLLESTYAQQKRLGLFDGTGIESLEDYKAALKLQNAEAEEF